MRAALGILLVLNCLKQTLLTRMSLTSLTDMEKLFASFGSCDVEINEPCSSGKIVFYLHTKKAYNSSGFIALDPTLPSYFNASKETKIIIHGYVGHVDSKDSAFLREVYLQENEYNLVAVDWGQLTKLPCYPTAVFSTWQAGKCTAAFLENFVADQNFSRVHAVGFSLGAHAAAFASNQLRQKLNKQLGRITGLDPALPFFASLENAMKLDREDADFVDLIHTNIGVFGKIEPTGHVDFYVNGGFSQPACQNATNIPVCSHLMATIYYAESVTRNNRGFWGIPCNSHFLYLIGWCSNVDKRDRRLMGEKCDPRGKPCTVYFDNSSNSFAKVEGSLLCENKKPAALRSGMMKCSKLSSELTDVSMRSQPWMVVKQMFDGHRSKVFIKGISLLVPNLIRQEN